MSKRKKTIVVDGANLAYEEMTQDRKPKVSNIKAVMQKIRGMGLRPIVIVDASLIHDVDKPDQLDAMINSGQIKQVPAGTNADYFILKIAKEHNAQIVTNDQYKDFAKQFPKIDERRVPAMIVDGTVEIYEPALNVADNGNGQNNHDRHGRANAHHSNKDGGKRQGKRQVNKKERAKSSP